jgi:hypothetical protein
MKSPGQRTVAARAIRGMVQPALPLGYAEVHWEALPAPVREDVLARWCELLSLVAADQSESGLDEHAGDIERGRL